MYLIQTFLGIISFHQTVGLDGLKISPGVPVPHADELDRILTTKLFENTTDFDQNSIFDYLFGDGQNYTDTETFEHLDISVLDPETINKIVQVARRRNVMVQKYYNGSLEDKNILRGGWHHNEYYINRTMAFMQQSIYTTRRRMIATRPFRKKYQNDISYNIGILYGTLMQLRIKLDNVYASLSKMDYKHHFIYFLFLYQKCLAFNTDITFAVERIYDFHSKFTDMIIPEEEKHYYIDEPEQQNSEDWHDLPPPDSLGGNPDMASGPGRSSGAGPGSNPGMGPSLRADLNSMADLSPIADFGPEEIPSSRALSALKSGLSLKTGGLVPPP